MTTEIVDMLCEVVALVKSPATRIPFYVVKGGETVDKLLPAVQEVCKGINWEERESRQMSEMDQQKALAATIAIKGVFKDLPPEVQKAVSDLMSVAVSTTKTVKSEADLAAEKKLAEEAEAAKKAAEEKEKTEKGILELLAEVKQTVVNSDTKLTDSVAELKKNMTDLGSRIEVVEKSAGNGHSKAPEDTKGDKVEKGANVWAGAIPDAVLVQSMMRGGE